MNKIEQLHLEAHDFRDSAEITEDIAIEFAEWYFRETFNTKLQDDFKSTKELFQEFLKTKTK
jgi:hypothetical protein